MNKLVVGAADKTNYLLTLQADLIIDPHGKLAREFLKRLDPQKTCYLKASDTEHPFGVNPLQHGDPDKICDAFDALFPQGQNTLARPTASFVFESLLREKPRNLLHVLEMLRDNTTPVINDKRFDTARTLLEARLGKLFLNPTLTNILSHHTTFSFDKPIIADLSGIGETPARLLGGLLIACSKGHALINDTGFFRYPVPLAEERFTLVATFLDELPNGSMGIEDKTVFRTRLKDAEELCFYLGVMNPRQITDLGDEALTAEGLIYPDPPTAKFRVASHIKRSRAVHTRLS